MMRIRLSKGRASRPWRAAESPRIVQLDRDGSPYQYSKLADKCSLLRFLFMLAGLVLGSQGCATTTTFPNFSHWDNIPSIASFPAEKAPAVIHRASRGLEVDEKYRKRASQARRRPDISWGAYHFCTGASVQRQLDFAMNRVGYDRSGPYRTLMVFDFEHNVVGRSNHMRISSLAELIRRFHARTGAYPVIYVNPNWFNQRVRSDRYTAADARVIAKCPLWTSAYKAKPNQTAIFRKWSLWQYAGDSTNAGYGDYVGGIEKMNHPRGIRGVGRKLEMNLYRGSRSSLKSFWARHSIPTRY